MKTTIGPIVLNTKGYDVLAELEQQEDMYGIKNYLQKRKQEAAEKAQQYLSENPKSIFYIATGYPTDIPWDEAPEDIYNCLMCYTDQEVQRLKQLIVEVWNQDCNPEEQLQSYEELCLTTDLRELRGINEELDALLWGRAEACDFDLGSIDLNTSMHAYLFSTYEYNIRKQEMNPYRCFHRVVLTDEEYQFLLTEQLNNRHFTFNHLLLCRPELAQKICAATADKDPISISESPYIILMDELQSDMEKILGHEPLHEMLCSCNTDGYNYVVNVYVENDELSLNWQRVKDDDFTLESLCEGNTKGIDAKAVMQLLGAKDYYEMMDRICERFSGKDAYENLLEYLDQNGVRP
jgi:hypothetical protein